jgi:hypothetical protein
MSTLHERAAEIARVLSYGADNPTYVSLYSKLWCAFLDSREDVVPQIGKDKDKPYSGNRRAYADRRVKNGFTPRKGSPNDVDNLSMVDVLRGSSNDLPLRTQPVQWSQFEQNKAHTFGKNDPMVYDGDNRVYGLKSFSPGFSAERLFCPNCANMFYDLINAPEVYANGHNVDNPTNIHCPHCKAEYVFCLGSNRQTTGLQTDKYHVQRENAQAKGLAIWQHTHPSRGYVKRH